MTSSIVNIALHPTNSELAKASVVGDSVSLARKSAVTRILSQLLQTPKADDLLTGLNDILGGATHSAFTGSVALALHQINLGGRCVRRPNNIDLVVSHQGLQKLGGTDQSDLLAKGFTRPAGSKNQLEWSDGQKKIQVDLIPISFNAAGRGLYNAGKILDAQVAPLDVIISNLQTRAQDAPLDNQIKSDLAALFSTLDDPRHVNWAHRLPRR